MRCYGLTREEIKGRYRVKCLLTLESCRICSGPSKVRGCEHASLQMDGISPLEASRLFALAQEDSMREIVMEGFYRTGKLPEKRGDARRRAQQMIDDPLRNFPNDVKYPTAIEMEGLEKAAKMKALFNPSSSPEHFQWTADRKAAVKGEWGPAAKRCSVNDVLWGRYLALKNRGVELTLEAVRQMLAVDVAMKKIKSVEDPAEQDALFERIRLR